MSTTDDNSVEIVTPVVPDGEVYVAEKKEGARQRRQLVFETKENARAWLREQIEADPFVDEYETEQYSKLCYVDGDGRVVGHVSTVGKVDEYE